MWNLLHTTVSIKSVVVLYFASILMIFIFNYILCNLVLSLITLKVIIYMILWYILYTYNFQSILYNVLYRYTNINCNFSDLKGIYIFRIFNI